MDEDDFDFSDEDLNEFEKQRKAEEERIKKHPLYSQGQEILHIIRALLDSVNDDDNSFRETLLESAMLINAKLFPMMQAESYVYSMQNAAIIRSHAEYLRISNHSLKRLKGIDQTYVQMFREEMEKFRVLFYEFMGVIKKIDRDEPADEWGLFIR